MTTESPVLESSASTIEVDLACSKCGYNLKGLKRSGNCPECGQPIEQTINFGLHCADPAWLKYQSVTMLLLGGLTIVPPGEVYGEPWLQTLRIVPAMVGLYGLIRLSRPDPSDPMRDGPLRGGIALSGFTCGLLALLRPAARYENILATVSVLSVYYAATVVQWWLLLILICRFCSRTRDRTLMGHARLCLWAYPLVLLLAPLPLAFIRPPNETLSVLMVTQSWLASVTIICTVLLFGRMFEVFRAAAVKSALSSGASCHSEVPDQKTSPEPGASSAGR